MPTMLLMLMTPSMHLLTMIRNRADDAALADDAQHASADYDHERC
jgi:hypothetical protein